MECFLCLEFRKDEVDCIELKSATWKELQIEIIIEKHLWPMSTFKTESLWLCLTCWHILYEFHKFYERLETAHVLCEGIVKCESDPCLNAEEFKSKETLFENLTEPEIELDQESTASVKEECEDTDNQCYYNDEDDIPLINICGKGIGSLWGDPEKNSNKETEDPLNKSTKSKINKSKKRKTKKKTTKKGERLKKFTKNIKVDTLAEKISLRQSTAKDIIEDNSHVEDISSKEIEKEKNSNYSNQPPTDSYPSSSLIIPLNDNKSKPSYFYESTVSCREYDKFISKHFKLTCHACQKHQFGTFSELQTHFRETHDDRGYVVCCGIKFFDRSSLVDHINCHFNPEYFKCQYCTKVLTLRKRYNFHMKSHDKSHVCDICDKKFQRRCFLNYHKQTHLSKEEKKIPCSDCGKFFGSKHLLTNHRRVVHMRKYAKLCNICGQSLVNLESFKRHMKLHEGKTDPPLNCEICGLLVSSELYLKAHMKLKHPVGGNTEKVCPICQKVLQTSVGLRHHIRRNHDTGYIHKCSICEKAFKRIDHLKAHMNIHTGADKSQCPWCPRTFNANSSMHHHRKNAHPKEWEEARRKKYISGLPSDFKTNEANSLKSTVDHELDFNSVQSRLIVQ